MSNLALWSLRCPTNKRRSANKVSITVSGTSVSPNRGPFLPLNLVALTLSLLVKKK